MSGIKRFELASGLGDKDTDLLKRIREKGALKAMRHRSKSPVKINPNFLNSRPPPGLRSPRKGRSPAPSPPSTPKKESAARVQFGTPARQEEKQDLPVPLALYPVPKFTPLSHERRVFPKPRVLVPPHSSHWSRQRPKFEKWDLEEWRKSVGLGQYRITGLTTGVDLGWRGRSRKRKRNVLKAI